MVLTSAALLVAMSVSKASEPTLPREMRAVWIATVDNIDWPSKRTLTVAQQRTELLAVLDRCSELNLNAVILQVRPAGDALYASALEPWSEYLTGVQGQAPDEAWDPLQFTIAEGHARGLEVHAWCNPFRAKHSSAMGELAESHLAVTRPDLVKEYGNQLWFDPGEKDVQEHSLAVVRDLVCRYDLDGIHIDDYFYPYPIQGVGFGDDTSRGRYTSRGGTSPVSAWRRANVDLFVERMSRTIREAKPWVRFGISPFGIYRPGIPKGIEAGLDQYAQLYADPVKWLREGWCDYLAPQLYWKTTQTKQSFSRLLDWWREQPSKGVHIWPGLFASRTIKGIGDWTSTELLKQIRLTRKDEKEPGQLYFSARAFMDSSGAAYKAAKTAYPGKALPPACLPNVGSAPNAPALQSLGDQVLIETTGALPRFWVIYKLMGTSWKIDQVISGQKLSFEVAPGQQYAVAAIDVFGREGDIAKL